MKTFILLFIGLIIGFVLGAVVADSYHRRNPDSFTYPLSEKERTKSVSAIPSPPSQVEKYERSLKTSKYHKYTHNELNIRSGRGTEFEIVSCLRRGEKVTVDSLVDDWYRVLKSDKPIGYGYSKLLFDQSPKSYDFKIQSVQYRITEKNDVWWRFAWTLKINNTGIEPLVGLRTDIKFLDSEGFVVDTDTEYGIYIAPGETRTIRENTLIDFPSSATIRQISAEVRL